MSHKMQKKDYTDAAIALADWLASQDIAPEDGVRVLTMTVVGLIGTLAAKKGVDPKDGGKIIADIIVRSLS